MALADKLQLRRGQALSVLGEGPDLEAPSQSADEPDAFLFCCRTRDELERWRGQLVARALEDRLVWVAYPKAGQLGTDLNRDLLRELLLGDGVRPVRQISIDQTWSALRFRPG